MAKKAAAKPVKKSTTKSSKLSPEQFVLKAIVVLRGKDKAGKEYKSIHTRYSGFNEAFRVHYPDLDPIKVTKKMEADKKIVIRFARGGALLYLPKDAPQGGSGNSGSAALNKILSA